MHDTTAKPAIKSPVGPNLSFAKNHKRFPTTAWMHREAPRHVPRFAFEYGDTGAGNDVGIAHNWAAFDAIKVAPRYGVTLIAVEWIAVACPLFLLREVRKLRSLAPFPVVTERVPASAESVMMHSAIFRYVLGSRRVCAVVQRPISRFPIIHAATVELRQDLEHRAAGRCDKA